MDKNLIKNNSKGITLIALVITIIVLLILAGVTISALSGENGILQNTRNAKVKSEEADAEDQIKLLVNEWQIEKYAGTKTIEEYYADKTASLEQDGTGYKVTLNGYEATLDEKGNLVGEITKNDTTITPPEETTPGEPDENGVFTVASTINGQAAGTNNPKIPAGFKPLDAGTAVWGDGTAAPTQAAVNAGLVIQHGVDKSEYVWIPVEGIYTDADADAVAGNSKVVLGRYEFNSSTGQATKYTGSYIEENKNDTANLKNYGNTIAKDIEGFISSVETNGGYYIARYEASKGANGRALSIVSQENTPSNQSYVLENNLWVYITQQSAATACQNLYEGINSDLVNSYAWDTALLFIQKNSGNSDYSIDKSGNVGTTIQKNTGETGDEVCNIYDISGNSYEWTTETYSDSDVPYTYRGGCWRPAGSWGSILYYAGYRQYAGPLYENNEISFRPILYL